MPFRSRRKYLAKVNFVPLHNTCSDLLYRIHCKMLSLLQLIAHLLEKLKVLEIKPNWDRIFFMTISNGLPCYMQCSQLTSLSLNIFRNTYSKYNSYQITEYRIINFYKCQRFLIWQNISPIVSNTDSLDFHPYEINLTLSILYWRCHIILNITMTSITQRAKRKCGQQWLPIRPRFWPKFFLFCTTHVLKSWISPCLLSGFDRS